MEKDFDLLKTVPHWTFEEALSFLVNNDDLEKIKILSRVEKPRDYYSNRSGINDSFSGGLVFLFDGRKILDDEYQKSLEYEDEETTLKLFNGLSRLFDFMEIAVKRGAIKVIKKGLEFNVFDWLIERDSFLNWYNANKEKIFTLFKDMNKEILYERELVKMVRGICGQNKEEAATGQLRKTNKSALIFKKRGDFWEISFYDKSPSQVKHTLGMSYIYHLLNNPNQSISCEDLFFSANPPPMDDDLKNKLGEKVDKQKIDGKEIPSYEQKVDHFGNERLDEKAIKNYKKRLSDLQKLKEKGCPQDHADRVEDEILKIEKHLKQDTEKGKSKKLVDDLEKYRPKVTKAVETAISIIEESNQKMGNHLKNSISKGKYFCYSPDKMKEVAWVL